MDITELIAHLLNPFVHVGLIIGIAEIIKRLGLPKKYIPLVDVALGLLSGICVYGIGLEYGVINGILIGLAMGLSACGLFSGIKNLTEKKSDV